MNFEPKLYTNISIESLKQEITTEYRLWALMRSYVQRVYSNNTGATKVHQLTHAEFRTMLNRFGFSRQLYYKFVANPTNVFFSINEKYITFKGLATVCRNLNVMPGHVYRVPVEQMKKLDTFNAYCYYGYMANHINNVMQSREAIADATNVSKVTQIKYESILGLTKYQNYFVFNPDGFNDGLEIAESVIENNALVSIYNKDKSKNYLLFQSANTYMAYVNHIKLFNDKESKRIYNESGFKCKTAYRKESPQSGKELKLDKLNMRTLHDKTIALRGLIANEMDDEFIHDFGYLKTLTESNTNVRIFFVHNFSQALDSIRHYA